MVNVRVEHSESYKVLYENSNVVHISQQYKKAWNGERWREEKLIENCPNEEVEIISLKSGAIAKIPVMLAAFTVQININSLIEISEPILQIKEIAKKVNIHQCNIMQDTDVLFIKGSVKKSIEYYTNTSSNSDKTYGAVQTLILDIPFKCTTNIKYNIMEPQEIIKNTAEEFKYIKNNEYLNFDLDENENIVYDDFNYFNQITNEYYNEVPYCEITSSKIIESEKLIEIKTENDNISIQQGIYAIEGEGVLYVEIRILQNRLVSIPMMP
ncbi:CsxC family protein [Proteiniborus sp. MB09-C3]|uniref:CsxC family protein n=1 Tax=Proteiniborus sp. MB09-C3 TaxID=3050072 RepID=UPI00255583E8|nr:hypothetical protein [Proteiniborus sp. MB09-C3]WIV11219.1 hypothetical protein QO263_13810 [Proteiniborus sp. MB09-C3]